MTDILCVGVYCTGNDLPSTLTFQSIQLAIRYILAILLYNIKHILIYLNILTDTLSLIAQSWCHWYHSHVVNHLQRLYAERNLYQVTRVLQAGMKLNQQILQQFTLKVVFRFYSTPSNLLHWLFVYYFQLSSFCRYFSSLILKHDQDRCQKELQYLYQNSDMYSSCTASHKRPYAQFYCLYALPRQSNTVII